MTIAEKKKRVEQKSKELAEVFSSIDENKKKMTAPLIQSMAFACVEIAELEADLQKNGWTEEYQNGDNQRGIKKAAKADVYFSLQKTFLATAKQLIELCPDKPKLDKLKSFMEE